MALALTNPNDRRHINIITRYVMKHPGSDPVQLVGEWNAWAAKGTKGDKPAKFRRQGKKGNRGASFAAKFKDGVASMPKLSPTQKKQRRNEYARVRRSVAKAFEGHPGYGPSKGKRGRTVSYAGRAMGTHASRYTRTHGKRTTFGERYKGKGKTHSGYVVVDAAGLQGWNVKRGKLREATGSPDGTRKKGGGRFGMASQEQLVDAYGQGTGLLVLEGYETADAWRTKYGKPKAKKGSSGKMSKGLSEYQEVKAKLKALGMDTKGKLPALKSRLAAKQNPFGALALTNQGGMNMAGVTGWVGYAAPLAIGGAAAGVLHVYIAPMVAEWVEDIPVVNVVPNTVIGLLVGAVAGIAAKYAPVGPAQIGLGTLAAASIALGPAIDAMNAVADFMGGDEGEDEGDYAEEDDFSEDDFSLDDDLSGLALTNMGALALENDGFASQVAGLNEGADYTDASLADAYYSGADFDVDEGQALVNGRGAWLRRFGSPPRNVNRKAKAASHLAGRKGHRWGWCIKMLGWRRCAALASMKPANRIRVLKQIRASAIKAFAEHTELSREDHLATTPVPQIAEFTPTAMSAVMPSAGVAAAAAEGALGPSGAGALAGALFMGD